MQLPPLADVAVVPDWIEAFLTAIDTKKFDKGFDKLGADVPWSYGIVEGRGAETLAALFRKTVEGIDTKHRILSCWRGPGVVIARGLAETTPRDGSGTRPGPFVWIFYVDEGHEDRLTRFFIVVGPVRTHPFP